MTTARRGLTIYSPAIDARRSEAMAAGDTYAAIATREGVATITIREWWRSFRRRTGPAPAKPVAKQERAPFVGPILSAGPGERRDCGRDGECLSNFVKHHGRDVPSAAHCPAGCTWWREMGKAESGGAEGWWGGTSGHD